MEVRINSLTEAYEFLNSLLPDNSDFYFRGQANFEWNLQPSVYRFNNFLRYQTAVYENTLLQFKPEKPLPPLIHTEYDLEWLMLCQHYGVPTRLLDWSSDFTTALFFACYDKENLNKDGVLFICDKNDYSSLNSYGEFQQNSRNVGKISFMKTMIPNPRMRSQSGCFMIWDSYPLDKDKSTESYDLWEYHKHYENDFTLKKIIISSQAKLGIIADLRKIYDITYNSLYLNANQFVRKWTSHFDVIRERVYLITLWITDAERLTDEQVKHVLRLTNGGMKNSFKGCVNLSSLVLGRKPK
ncbi:MAG: FRG domain-containing protein [Flavobacteriaceae bacterium]|nr:FRG domain-containing protein [Flavobacteriaceae bacterium]